MSAIEHRESVTTNQEPAQGEKLAADGWSVTTREVPDSSGNVFWVVQALRGEWLCFSRHADLTEAALELEREIGKQPWNTPQPREASAR